MTTRDRSDLLVRDIAQLFVKYPAAEWRLLVEQLNRGGEAQARIAAAIQTLVVEAGQAKANRPRRSAKRSIVKRSASRAATGKLARGSVESMSTYSAERSEMLTALEHLLIERGALRTASDLREIFLKTGGKGDLPKSRTRAILALMRHLDSVTPAAFNQAIDAIREEGSGESSGDAYARWFNLIRPTGASKAMGIRPAREIAPSERPSAPSLLSSSLRTGQDPVSGLTDYARELLIEAADDKSGVLLRIEVLGGRYFQTNGKKFGVSGEAREFARYEDGLEQLLQAGLITLAGTTGEVFRVTEPGYQMANHLRPPS